MEETMTRSQSLTQSDRYDDGLAIDYPMMIRLWTSFDRSVAAFNQKCGVIAARRNPDVCKDRSAKESK